MSLLENELIRMYFGFECPRSMGCTDPNCYERTIQLAYKVVQAMEEPIKVGEKYLEIDHVSGLCGERVAKYETKGVVFNPWGLRLPSRFQATVEKKECCPHGVEAKLIYPCNECIAKLNNPAPAETEKCWCKPDQETCRSLNVCGCPCHKPAPKKCPEGDCDCPEPKAKVAPDPSREDEVERLIKLIDDLFGGDGRQNLTKHVRHLVEVVRNEAKGR